MMIHNLYVYTRATGSRVISWDTITTTSYLVSAHPRHHHVEKDHVRHVGFLLQDRQRLLTVHRFGHLIQGRVDRGDREDSQREGGSKWDCSSIPPLGRGMIGRPREALLTSYTSEDSRFLTTIWLTGSSSTLSTRILALPRFLGSNKVG